MLRPEQMNFANFNRSYTTDEVFSICRDFSDVPEQQPFSLVCCSAAAAFHLRHAIANAHPEDTAEYLSTDQLTAQLVDAIRDGTVSVWRRTLARKVLLVLDDFQYAAGKDSTLQEIYRLLKQRLELGHPTLVFSTESVQNAAFLSDNLKSLLSLGRVVDALQINSRYERPYEGNAPFVFVSYSHHDIDQAKPIILRLQRQGYRVWYDEGIDPGTEWDEIIASHIEHCGVMLSLISDHYLRSDNCRDELNFARDLGRERLLIYLENVRLPAGMAMRMNRLQAIHKYTYSTEDSFYEKLLNTELLSVCRNLSEAPAADLSESLSSEDTKDTEADIPEEEDIAQDVPVEAATSETAPAAETAAEPPKDMDALLRAITEALPTPSKETENASEEAAAEDAAPDEKPAEAEPPKDMDALLRAITEALPTPSKDAEDASDEARAAEDTPEEKKTPDTSAIMSEIERALAASRAGDKSGDAEHS